MFLVMYFPEVYYLNSDLVLCFVVDSFVDLTKSSFTYFLLYVVFTNGVAREVLFHRAELVVGEAQSMVARLSLCFCHLFMICLPWLFLGKLIESWKSTLVWIWWNMIKKILGKIDKKIKFPSTHHHLKVEFNFPKRREAFFQSPRV